MRPIDRGNVPQIGGVDKTVADYKDWRQDLIDVIGNYCSYCNMTLNDSPQVEHVTPKNPQPDQPAGSLLAWSNMLLACGPCNRTKGNKPNSTATHYMPDSNNTHLVFDYVIGDHPEKANAKFCVPVPKNGIDAIKARSTIDLCGLDALTFNERATDLRWKYRFEAWYAANSIWRDNWNRWGFTMEDDFAALLRDAVLAKGFFSIWYLAFNDIPIIKRTLIHAFIGTDPNSFQANIPFDPIPRNPASVADTI